MSPKSGPALASFAGDTQHRAAKVLVKAPAAPVAHDGTQGVMSCPSGGASGPDAEHPPPAGSVGRIIPVAGCWMLKNQNNSLFFPSQR